MSLAFPFLHALLIGMLPIAASAQASPDVRVTDDAGLRRALAAAKPGSRIRIAPGTYTGGHHLRDLGGDQQRPILIAGEDPEAPPVFSGGNTAFQLSNPAHVELRDLVIEDTRSNGLNIDDGGSMEATAEHVTLRNLVVRRAGGSGNIDGIKLSGLRHLRIIDCTVEDWADGGSGIDMVGCRDGEIRGCRLRHKGPAATSSGIQAKGGTRDIRIHGCRFTDVGHRGINIGGSTALAYFRPQPPPGYEAANITVTGCTFVGSNAPIAFVGVDGALVRHNTFIHPARWVLRILQETREEGFVPSRNGRFEQNLIVFRSDELVEAVNVGPHTAPDTFRFAGNWWYCEDRPRRSRPDLPVEEQGGTWGRDPSLARSSDGDWRLAADSPARGVGAHAAAD